MTTQRRTIAVCFLVAISLLSVVPPSAGSVYTGFSGGSLDPGHAVPQPTSKGAGFIDARAPERTPGIDADVTSLHEEGVTGEGVKVGVIGSRFSERHPSITAQVAASRQFGNDGRLLVGGDAHDTAVAEIVARTAPGSELYLAGVGTRATPEGYAAAVTWLLENDVDVVVDSASYFPPDADSMDRMNAVAENASDQGVVFVTSAGNYADRHWAGTGGGGGWVSFAEDAQYNFLGDGTVSGDTSLRLYWSGAADFDLYLYRHTKGPNDPVVAKSVREQTGNGSHAEAIDVSLPSGRYYVAIRAAEGAPETSLDLFAATHELSVTSTDGSMVAPATARNVIAVGATDRGTGQLRPYSSNGAFLDISAPDGTRTRAAGDLYGSSAAAPLVAGTAALMASADRDLSPVEAERILKRTADGSGRHLQLDAADAVHEARKQPSLRSQYVTRDGNDTDDEASAETKRRRSRTAPPPYRGSTWGDGSKP